MRTHNLIHYHLIRQICRHQIRHIKKIKYKSVASVGKMTRQTHPQVMTLIHLIHPRTVIIDVDNAKNKKHRKEDPIKLCATLTAKLLTTTFKSKIIKFKLDEDPLHHWIYFLIFIDSLCMIFSQHRETCEVLLDYPKIGGDDVVEDYAKKAIRKLLHANNDVNSRILIADSMVTR